MSLPYELDTTAPERARLGLIVLSIDETVEEDFRRTVPAGRARVFHTRMYSDPDLSEETFPAMAARLPDAAALLPGEGLDVIGYACTSGGAILGEAHVAELIGRTRPDVPVTNPLSALKAACKALGVSRLGLISPYIASVSDQLRAALEEGGIAVSAFGSFDQPCERLVTRISPDSIAEALMRIGQGPDCEAVFASCTNLRAAEVIGGVEQALGKPVLASNQVLAWHMLRLAGVSDALPEAGRLGQFPLR